MRQDIKTALNTSLWDSLNGPALDALGARACARRTAACDSLARRRCFRACRQALIMWNGTCSRRRRRSSALSRAGMMQRRHARELLRAFVHEWSAAPRGGGGGEHAAPVDSSKRFAAFAQTSSSALEEVSRCHEVDRTNASVNAKGGGCFRGLLHCLGAGRGRQTRQDERAKPLREMSADPVVARGATVAV